MIRIRILAGMIGLFVLIIGFSSCGTTQNAKLSNQRRGLMLMDKSEYTVNKGRPVPSKNYKAIKRKYRRGHSRAYRK